MEAGGKPNMKKWTTKSLRMEEVESLSDEEVELISHGKGAGGTAHGHGGHRAPEPQLPPGGTRVVPQIFLDVRPRDVGPDRRSDGWSPVNVLEDTVARMQRDMAEIRAENRLLRTPGVQPVVPTPRQAVLYNGWDDATAALQLFYHLQGDALNVALLVPMARQTSRKGLVDALSAHYGSPGRLQMTV